MVVRGIDSTGISSTACDCRSAVSATSPMLSSPRSKLSFTLARTGNPLSVDPALFLSSIELNKSVNVVDVELDALEAHGGDVSIDDEIVRMFLKSDSWGVPELTEESGEYRIHWVHGNELLETAEPGRRESR